MNRNDGRAGGSAGANASISAGMHESAPWDHVAPSVPDRNSNYGDLLLLEKKRKSQEEATNKLNSALVEETLTKLRAKAQELQSDKWMYQDVQI